MSALTANRDTPCYAPHSLKKSYPVKASTKIYAGSLVALNAGYLVPASTAAGLLVAGQAAQLVDNTSGADGDLRCDVYEGTFRWGNGDTIAQADVGSIAYAVDDATVSKDGTGKSVAGVIVDKDSSGVWVESKLLISGVLA